MKKDKPGLYFNGEFKASNYENSIMEIFKLSEFPEDFKLNTKHQANGYSIIDNRGVQHIYDLNPGNFYNKLTDLEYTVSFFVIRED